MRDFMKLTLLMTVILFSCSSNGSRPPDCGLAPSSPTDLTLVNDCDLDKKILFYYYDTTDNDFELIGTLTVAKKENKKICIENEGPVENGLYIKMNDRTKMIKLEYGQEFKLQLCDSSFQLENNQGPK